VGGRGDQPADDVLRLAPAPDRPPLAGGRPGETAGLRAGEGRHLGRPPPGDRRALGARTSAPMTVPRDA
jgi:hypothetical protein